MKPGRKWPDAGKAAEGRRLAHRASGVGTQASGAIPAATAAAEPPLEPPGTLSKSQGLRVGKKAEFSVDEPMANSSMLVLPKMGRPALFNFVTTVAS